MDVLLIISSTNQIIYQRQFKNKIPYEQFSEYISKKTKKCFHEDIILLSSGIVACTIKYDTLKFVGLISTECSSVLILDCLHEIADNLSIYFDKDINEEIIKTNHSTVAVLIEEMLDYGSPSMMESNALNMLVPTKTFLDRAVEYMTPTKLLNNLFSINNNNKTLTKSQTILTSKDPGEGMGVGSGMGTLSGILGGGSSIWWRKGNATYRSDEVYVDTIETLNCVVNKSGKVISSHITGQILVRSKLTGARTCQVILKNPDLLKNNISFHVSVNNKIWDDSKIINFIPPDGLFSLCHYSMYTGIIQPPITLKLNLIYPNNLSTNFLDNQLTRFEILLNHKNDFGGSDNNSRSSQPLVLEKVKIFIFLPYCIQGLTAGESSIGVVKYDDHKLLWTIPRLTLDSLKQYRCEGTLQTCNKSNTTLNTITDTTSNVTSKNEDFLYTKFQTRSIFENNQNSITPENDEYISSKDRKHVAIMQFCAKDWTASSLTVDSIDVIGTDQRDIFKGLRKATFGSNIEFRL